MLKVRPSLRWGLERRLAYIEERLFWEGSFNRADLIEQFGISVAQASADISRYRSAAPRNLTYDTRAKTYKASSTVRPVFSPLDPARYLAELRASSEGVRVEEGVAPRLLSEMVPLPARPVRASVLRDVVLAIKGRGAVDCTYLSFQETFQGRRRIEPHALVFDGMRWHARARDAEQNVFRDFTLSRLTETARIGDAEVDASEDRDWNTWVRLRLKPHPGLSDVQQRAVRADYGFEGETLDLDVRTALVTSTKRRLRLDLDWQKQPAVAYHLILLSEAAARDGSREGH